VSRGGDQQALRHPRDSDGSMISVAGVAYLTDVLMVSERKAGMIMIMIMKVAGQGWPTGS
jgi:hypothetical protein